MSTLITAVDLVHRGWSYEKKEKDAIH